MEPVTGLSAKGPWVGSPTGWKGVQLDPNKPWPPAGPDAPMPATNNQLPAYGAMSLGGQSFADMRPKYSDEELRQRTVAAQEVVQEHGIPNLVEQCRSGTDAQKEKAAALLSFIATHDFICAGMIVSAGGIAPLVAMLSAESGRGDDDQTIDMKEQACKTIRDLCIGDRGNQRPIAEKGAVVPLLTILCESGHPWSIREAASEALALLAYENQGGPAQEMLTAEGGVGRMHAVYKEAACTPLVKHKIIDTLRYLSTYNLAKSTRAVHCPPPTAREARTAHATLLVPHSRGLARAPRAITRRDAIETYLTHLSLLCAMRACACGSGDGATRHPPAARDGPELGRVLGV